MATIVNNAEIRVTTTGTAQAKAQLSGLTSGVKSMASSAATAAAAYITLRGVFNTVIKSARLAEEGFIAIRKVQTTLNSTGRAAETTAKQLSDVAGELMRISNFDDEDILQKSTNQLLRYTSIASSELPRVQKLIVDLSAENEDLAGNTRLLGMAMEDPILGLTRLRRAGVMFTEAQQDMIRGLVEQGKQTEAAGLLLDGLESKFGGAAEAAQKASVKLKNSWEDYLQFLGTRTAPVLNGLQSGFAIYFDSILSMSADSATGMTDNQLSAYRAIAENTGKLMLGLQGAVVIAGGLVDTIVTVAAGGIMTTINTAKDGLGKLAQKIWKGLVPEGFGADVLRGFGLPEDWITGIVEWTDESIDVMATANQFSESLEKNRRNWVGLTNNLVDQLNYIESNAKGLKRTLGEVNTLDLGAITDGTGDGGAVNAVETEADRIRKAYEELSAWLTDYNRSEQARVEALYRQRKAIIDTAQKQQLLTAQEYATAITDLDLWHLNETTKLTRQAQEEYLNNQSAYYEAVKFADANYYHWRQTQIEMETANLSGLTEQQATLLKEIRQGVLDAELKEYQDKLKAVNGEQVKQVSETAKQLEQLSERIQSSIASGFGSAFADAIVEGENFFKSMQKLFKDLVKMIIAELAKIAIMKLFAGLATGGVGAILSTGGGLTTGSSGFMTPTISTNSIDRRLDRLAQAVENNRPLVYTQLIDGVPFDNAVKRAALQANVL